MKTEITREPLPVMAGVLFFLGIFAKKSVNIYLYGAFVFMKKESEAIGLGLCLQSEVASPTKSGLFNFILLVPHN